MSGVVLLKSLWGLSFLVAGASAQSMCRCEAEFENFYDRRRLREVLPRVLHSTPYDYSDAYVDEDGYSIVEGVRVLPSNECTILGHSMEKRWIGNIMRTSRGGTSSTTDALSGWRSIFGRGGRSLADEEERENVDKEAEDEAPSPTDRYYDFKNDIKVVARVRQLKGSSKGDYHSTDDYYFSGGKGKGKGKGKGNRGGYHSSSSKGGGLPPIFQCPGETMPQAPIIPAPTEVPTPKPQEQIATTCPDGSTGPINPGLCVDFCPAEGPRPIDGCVTECPASGVKPAIGCEIRCITGDDKTPAGCKEACCERELCWNGEPAPRNPNQCVVLCPEDGSFFEGCDFPCPTDGERPAGCVDVCRGSSSDRPGCKDPCCDEEVLCYDGSAAPLDDENCIDFCPLDGRAPPPNCTLPCPPGIAEGTFECIDPTNKVPCCEYPTCSDGSPAPWDEETCVEDCEKNPSSSTCVAFCPDNGSKPLGCVERCDVKGGPRYNGCVEACCYEETIEPPTNIPTAEPQQPIATTCPDGRIGPIDPENCKNICPPNGPFIHEICEARCDENGDPPVGADCCVKVCDEGSNTVPEGCVETCCAPETEPPTSFPTAAPQQPIATTCPDGSIGPIDPENCKNVCPPNGPFVHEICEARCDENGDPPVGADCCVKVCDEGSNTFPEGCVEKCCAPETEPPSSIPTAAPQEPIATTCPDGTIGPIDPAQCQVICSSNGPFILDFCTPSCDENSQPPVGIDRCVVVCEDGSNDTPEGCTEACCPPETEAPTKTPTLSPSAEPTFAHSAVPTKYHSASPTVVHSSNPTAQPTLQPSDRPSDTPSAVPSDVPSDTPSAVPSPQPSEQPTESPTVQPSGTPSSIPTTQPSEGPTNQPSNSPTSQPSDQPSESPTKSPSAAPTVTHSDVPTVAPSIGPSTTPTILHSNVPTNAPSPRPTSGPTTFPTNAPSPRPTSGPTSFPTNAPSPRPTSGPTSFPTGAPVARIIEDCPDGSRGPVNPDTCRLVCPVDGQVKPDGCLEPCNQPNAPANCVTACPYGMETTGSICVEPCCLPVFDETCALDGSPAPKYPDNCALICPSYTDPNARDPPGCVDPCPEGVNIDPEVWGCADLCPSDGSVLPPTCQEPCCPELPPPTNVPTLAPQEPVATNAPTSAPQEAVATTCPDGTVGPIDPSKCEVVCPEGGPYVTGFCTPACETNGLPPDNETECIVVCVAGSNREPQGCIEACCFPETEAPTRAPGCPPDNGPRPVFDPIPPECESPTSVPQQNIIGPTRPTIPMPTFTRPPKGKGKGGGYFDYHSGGYGGKGKGKGKGGGYYDLNRSGSDDSSGGYGGKGKGKGGGYYDFNRGGSDDHSGVYGGKGKGKGGGYYDFSRGGSDDYSGVLGGKGKGKGGGYYDYNRGGYGGKGKGKGGDGGGYYDPDYYYYGNGSKSSKGSKGSRVRN